MNTFAREVGDLGFKLFVPHHEERRNMAKEVTRIVKIQIAAGKATPAPPVGQVLGPTGINMQEFCTKFNDMTRDKMGDIIPAVISIYKDRTFDFVIKTPPASSLILKAANLDKGSQNPGKEVAGTISYDSIKQIAEQKLVDLNAYDVESGAKIIAGTARQMGLKIEGME